MHDLDVLGLDDAPGESRPLLENSLKEFGMIPNLHGVIAASPQALEVYQLMHKMFQESSFNDEELTVVWQTINVEHGCSYCIPAHTAIAHRMKVSPSLIDALANNKPMLDAKLQALQDLTLKIVRERGKVSERDIEAFYAAGYGPRQVVEILLGLCQKVMSNYINHIAQTPIDEAFKKFI